MSEKKAAHQHHGRAPDHDPLVAAQPADQQPGADARPHQPDQQRPNVVTRRGGADATNGLVKARHEDHSGEHGNAEDKHRRHADRVVTAPEQIQREDWFFRLRLDEQEDHQNHQAERNEAPHIEVSPAGELARTGYVAFVGES